MSGRTVRSGDNDNGSRRSSGSSRKPRTIGSRGNTGRSSKSRAPRSVSSGHEIDEPEIIDDVTVAKGQAGAFVDARRLRSEDYVAETLHQTTGSLGRITPESGEFHRTRQRTQACERTCRCVTRVDCCRQRGCSDGANVVAALLAGVSSGNQRDRRIRCQRMGERADHPCHRR